MNNPLGGVSSASGGSLSSLETKNAVSRTPISLPATSKKAVQPVMGEAVPQPVSSDLAHLEGLRGQVQSGNYAVDAKATATRWLAISAAMVAQK
ncbi:hypothetical protein [Acidithiobacillus ferriphilus]|uniref:hypothetical protein n=1 Tax=Acidithiobacillus ferriphilus TaxID=1689834 RepID=UPI001E63A8A3|nr:hypothetical protein [Acidithiobacillus ferriphilus]UEP60073.1 hypothetical protein K1Y48_05410 [Acidithiobacillus ferriphilus]